jgi:hypothetical protein
MRFFKIVDQYDRDTGQKIGTRKVWAGTLCDFTGKLMTEFYGNPVIYIVDYNDTDPCFGDHEAERWLYKWNEQDGRSDLDPDSNDWDETSEIDSYELFGQTHYCFGTDDDGTEVFSQLLEEAKKEGFEIVSLDHLLRWSRGRMLEKLFKEGKYKPEQFIETD